MPTSSGEEDGGSGRLLAFWEGLAKLEEYFGGYNEPAILMNLSYPILTQIKHGKHPGIITQVSIIHQLDLRGSFIWDSMQELRDITISASVPSRHQINPPMPVSADVSLKEIVSVLLFF